MVTNIQDGWKLMDNYVLSSVPADDGQLEKILAVRIRDHSSPGDEILPWVK